MGQVRHGSATYCCPAGDLHSKSAERARTPSEQQYSDPLPGRALQRNVPRGASFALASEQGTGDQSQDRCEVAQAGDSGGLEDRAKGAATYCPDRGRGSDDRHIPAPQVAAAGRLPLCRAVDDPAPDPFSVAPMSATAWHLSPARRRGRQAQAPEVQARPIRCPAGDVLHHREGASS